MATLELNTVNQGSFFTITSILKNDLSENIGEIKVHLLDETIKDIQEASKEIDEITNKIVSSFEIEYDGFMFDHNIKPFEHIPYVIWGRVAVLDRLYIYPLYRNKGYATSTLNKLIKSLKEIYRADFLVLKPYPLYGTEDGSIIEDVPTKKIKAETVNSLITFYEKFGFKTQKTNKDYFQCCCLLDYFLQDYAH